MFNDWITINGHHTFSKSKVDGVETAFKEESREKWTLRFYVIVSGQKIEVDREDLDKKYITVRPATEEMSEWKWVKEDDRNAAIKEYHQKWFERLDIGNEEERKYI